MVSRPDLPQYFRDLLSWNKGLAWLGSFCMQVRSQTHNKFDPCCGRKGAGQKGTHHTMMPREPARAGRGRDARSASLDGRRRPSPSLDSFRAQARSQIHDEIDALSPRAVNSRAEISRAKKPSHLRRAYKARTQLCETTPSFLK